MLRGCACVELRMAALKIENAEAVTMEVRKEVSIGNLIDGSALAAWSGNGFLATPIKALGGYYATGWLQNILFSD